MLEILFGLSVCWLIARIADHENRSAVTWGLITFGICVGTLVLPIPYLRFILAGIIAFIALMVLNMTNR